MPCRDYNDDWGITNQRTQERLDNVTRLLCAVLQSTDKRGITTQLYNIEGLEDWWEDHKHRDKIRKQAEAKQRKQEQLKENALGKLTKEEKEALGL